MHNVLLIEDNAGDARLIREMLGEDPDAPFSLHCAERLSLGLEHLAAGGEGMSLNVGLGRGFSVRQVIDAAERVTGREVPVKTAARRAGDPAVLVASARAITSRLGWRARRVTLEEIIESAWRWHSTRPKGFDT